MYSAHSSNVWSTRKGFMHLIRSCLCSSVRMATPRRAAGVGELKSRANYMGGLKWKNAFVGPIFWRFVQVSLVCLENCLSLEINIAARPPSFSKTPHMARCSLIFRRAFPLAVELSCTFSWSWALSSLRAAFHRNVSKTKCNSVLSASRQRPASGSTRSCARLN